MSGTFGIILILVYLFVVIFDMMFFVSRNVDAALLGLILVMAPVVNLVTLVIALTKKDYRQWIAEGFRELGEELKDAIPDKATRKRRRENKKSCRKYRREQYFKDEKATIKALFH